MTKQDQTEGSPRFAPRPVSRPPVDPSTTRAFGRPDGVNGSFVGDGKQRDQGEFTPSGLPNARVVVGSTGGRATGRGGTRWLPSVWSCLVTGDITLFWSPLFAGARRCLVCRPDYRRLRRPRMVSSAN